MGLCGLMGLNRPLNVPKKQKNYYSGKKKRYTLKTQLVVGREKKTVICTDFASGQHHGLKLFKDPKTHIHPDI